MKVSELIAALESVLAESGDLPVAYVGSDLERQVITDAIPDSGVLCLI